MAAYNPATDTWRKLPAGPNREGGYEGNHSVLWSALPTPFSANAEERVLGGVERLVEQLGQD